MFKLAKPIYEQIYETIKTAIVEGKYKEGERIPSEKELADTWNVSVITPRKSLEMLASEGLIFRQVGRGSFVKELAINETKVDSSVRVKPVIGVIMTDFDESYGIGLLNGIEHAAEERAFIVLRRTFGSVDKEQAAIRDLMELGIDGLIILPSQATFFNSEILKLIVDQFPFVLLDRYLKGVAASAVSTDNIGAAKKGTDYLFGLGHKTITLLSPPPVSATAIEDRIEGFVRAHIENGMTKKPLMLTELISTLPDSFKEPNISNDLKKIKDHLQKNKNISALFALEYNIALLAKQAVEELGLSVPKDISILCFDSPPCKPGAFTFTHLLQNQEKMGRIAVEQLLGVINNAKSLQTTLLDTKLIEGQSTTKK
ncbi:GntR family transcriptional regulator [Metabacillus sp. Hm71]|uniref:GntR family transcriptional regulator n=1 Tax=Metabacillus sp. Hm71 TaxID=3450743 RepID=UPI003F4291A3